MEITWERIKDSLQLLAENSGASIDTARGSIMGVASALTAIGMSWDDIWQNIIKCLPDKVRVEAIPTAWLHAEGNWNSAIIKGFVDGNIVKFPDLLKEIPEDMKNHVRIGDNPNLLTCRDEMLAKYLHICSIFQRETEREYAFWNSDLNGDPILEPQLVYSFAPFRHAGSQNIAEWAVSDHRKQHKEAYNWHGQNTSRWLYAGCLLVDNGRVSIHT